MKYIVKLLIYLVLIFTLIPNGNAAENDYGKAIAWCNDEPATVNDLEIKIDETIVVKVEVTSKIVGFFDMQLYEPGVTQSFDVISGPSNFDEWVSEYDDGHQRRSVERRRCFVLGGSAGGAAGGAVYHRCDDGDFSEYCTGDDNFSGRHRRRGGTLSAISGDDDDFDGRSESWCRS